MSSASNSSLNQNKKNSPKEKLCTYAEQIYDDIFNRHLTNNIVIIPLTSDKYIITDNDITIQLNVKGSSGVFYNLNIKLEVFETNEFPSSRVRMTTNWSQQIYRIDVFTDELMKDKSLIATLCTQIFDLAKEAKLI
jgi:hypothetical protein